MKIRTAYGTKPVVPFLIICLLGVLQLNQICHAQTLFPANVHRVLFLGNSITYAGTYVTNIEAYYRLQYPNQSIEFINVGLPSETVSGLSEDGHADGKFPRPDLHERLERVLKLTKPDFVFACYGMNDGIYLPLDETRFQKFKDGMNWLHAEVVKLGVPIVHLTPPIYDEQRGNSKGYAAVLDRYSDWLLEQKTVAKWSVIDLHYPMKTYLEAHRKVDAAFGINGFALATDGVHPGEVGHWIMAKSILLGMGDKAVASAPDLAASVESIPNAAQVIKLVAARQSLMKDAWLTATGHKRPGMNVGLPLAEAQTNAAELDAQIRKLLP
ncbi:SGNH/GDSL hydrolase family protein [Spirosoma fluviale]|nr:SGNH/GDSL hydrolase family protein [Spirosoma fluviale]